MRKEGEGKGAERLHGSIARQLGIAIVSGTYPPGAALDNEIQAAERLHVSRSAYREALRILAAKGLVESRPKTGTQVCPRDRWNLLDGEVLAWAFQSEPTEQFVRSLFELRMIVEPGIAALAAARRDGPQLTGMRRALLDMEQQTLRTEEGRLADIAFHELVVQASGNPLLAQLSVSIGAAVRWTTIYKQRLCALPRDPMPEHWAVFDAIAVGDGAAAQAAMGRLIALALADTEAKVKKYPHKA